MPGAECFPRRSTQRNFYSNSNKKEEVWRPPGHQTFVLPGTAATPWSPLGPLRGRLGRFCPWRAVFGASAGQIGAFLPLGCSRWGHCGANWGVFAPEGRSLGPPRGNLGRFCPWGAVFGASAGQISPFLPLGQLSKKPKAHCATDDTATKKNSPQANCHNWPRGL